MGNPQQPELARSRKTPSQDQDSVAAVVDGQQQLDTDAPRGPVPAENQPGHHPPEEQDKPDMDAFAQRFGIVEGPEEARPAAVREAEASRRGWARAKAGSFAFGTGVLAAVAVLVSFVLRRKRRRARSK